MQYLERPPIAEPLRPFVKALWHSRSSGLAPRRERILPDGCVQVILNLARDFIWDYAQPGPPRPISHSLIVGPRSVYDIVDTSDMADLAGIAFLPAGFAAFTAGCPMDCFSNRSVPALDLWGPRESALLRERLLEAPDAESKLRVLEQFLLARLTTTGSSLHPLVGFALRHLTGAASVRETATQTGWSERYFSQLFRRQVGLSPKAWCRVRRFQRAVRQLHAGVEVPWAELAIDCGYYDQSHFSNEFRAFSGIDPTSYRAGRTIWANHVPLV